MPQCEKIIKNWSESSSLRFFSEAWHIWEFFFWNKIWYQNLIFEYEKVSERSIWEESETRRFQPIWGKWRKTMISSMSGFWMCTQLHHYVHTTHPMFFTYIQRSAKLFVKMHHTYLVPSQYSRSLGIPRADSNSELDILKGGIFNFFEHVKWEQ